MPRFLPYLLLFLLPSLSAAGQDSSLLQITQAARDAGQFSLRWTPALQGRDYTVQARDGVVDGLWINVPDVSWPISETQWIDARPMGPQARFYRVLAVERAQRGAVLATNLLVAFTPIQLNGLFQGQSIPLTAQYGVRVYKVVYETIDPAGARTQASGVLAVPENPVKAVPLASYQHGTLAKKTEAPSATILGEAFLGIAFASTGYATVVPDYLGMGDSPGLHPYHHARSEATACVDMLRAARVVCAGVGLSLNSQLFILGYSEGGHATMALHRELEAFHKSEFSITASAPMAGAYDISGITAIDFLQGHPVPNPYYFAYLLAAYQEVYHWGASLADLLAPPYNTNLPPLLKGQSSGGEINAVMPQVVTDILKPELLAAFRANPTHPLRLALADNDLYRWTPQAPLRLYHCRADQDVIFANSEVARDSFISRGASQVQLIDPNSTAGHGDCVQPSLLDAKAWFDSLKE